MMEWTLLLAHKNFEGGAITSGAEVGLYFLWKRHFDSLNANGIGLICYGFGD
jgi:hypothetical protein